MLYAKIVLGIPVEGPFDYIVPNNLSKKIKVGIRVWVNFHNKRMLGYVVELTKKTNIKNLKSILELIDGLPLLDKNTLLLTKELSDYYGCSWGEAIEITLPESLRRGKVILNIKEIKPKRQKERSGVILVHDLDGQSRWDIYITYIKQTLDNNKSVIVLLPDINSVLKAKEIINKRLNHPLVVLYRKQPKELNEWIKVKEGKANIVIGTRASIFAPFNNLGLVIIDDEQDSIYKQDRMPHYNSREVAFMRMGIEKTKLILGSSLPSLESFYLVKKSKIKYIFIPRKRDFPEIKIIDIKELLPLSIQRRIILSKYLQDSINSILNSNGKILLFLNRRGFATFVWCHFCGIVLKCPRCNVNLVYHFKDSMLNCHYCNFKMQPPQICPNCNSGYIRYSGIGVEKVESELSRLFPQAKIKRLDNQNNLDTKETNIFVAMKSIIKQINFNFDLIGVLSIDNSLNRVDFRSAEKTFSLLIGLLRLTEKKFVIQTEFPNHYCFKALVNKDINMFYDEELKQRRQLNFPPYKHIGLVKLRGEKEIRVKEASYALFKRLKKYNKNKTLEIISITPGYPAKLRGNFYWQILLKSDSGKKISNFLKKRLKDFSRSNITVTIDIDPL